MTKSNWQSSIPSIRRGTALNLLGAILLILLGIVLQLSELGYGHLCLGNFWFFSMIATGLWNILAAHSSVPAAREIFSFWPLLLVCVGIAALLVRSANCPDTSTSSGAGAAYEK
ncbi:MAG TPA: hypothetical protein VMU43_01210 [Candidatus Acidoferrum sp.]|nr:hypothetical protein [Candidatus Acidoferrum sp.]